MSGRIDEIRARLAAQQEAWAAVQDLPVGSGDEDRVVGKSIRKREDLESHAPSDIAYLLAEVERLTKQHEYRSTSMEILATACAKAGVLKIELEAEVKRLRGEITTERAMVVDELRRRADRIEAAKGELWAILANERRIDAEDIEHGDHRSQK